MRMSIAVLLTCVVVSFLINAAAQGLLIHDRSIVDAPPANASQIDASQVKFIQDCSDGPPKVYGIIARSIDLANDLTARQALEMGFTFGRAKCPSATDIYVVLRLGSPATFTDFRDPQWRYLNGNFAAFPSDHVGGFWSMGNPGQISGYSNFPEALAEQRRAEQAIIDRSQAFLKANGVAHFVTIQQLAANPFVYQNQVVAIYGEFQQMNSATQGLFSSKDKPFVFSAIPTARFTQQRSMVVLAGRVLGNIEIKLPVLGSTLVPHLSFVGSAFCQQPECSEYSFDVR